MVRKISLIILLVAIIVGISVAVAFNLNTNNNVDNDDVNIVVTNFTSYDFLRAITKDVEGISLNFILGPGKDAHSYDPTPQDVIEMGNSDMLVYIGGDLEQWSDTVVPTLNNEGQVLVKISDSVDVQAEKEIDGAEHAHDHAEEEHDHAEDEHDHAEEEHDHAEDEHDHAEEEHDHAEDEHDHVEDEHDHSPDEFAFDSHIWTSPANAILMVKELEKQMSAIDPENASTYKTNSEAYIKQIEDLDSKIQEVIDNKTRDRLVFGDKMPFQYFLDYYKLNVSAAFTGCSTESEPSSQTVAYLVDLVKEQNIPVVLYTELNDGRVANLITTEASNGSVAMQLQTLHNLTKDNFDKGETYVSLMTSNIEVLKKALN